MEESHENRQPWEAPEEQLKREACDLVEVEKGLAELTKILFDGFGKRHIDATTTVVGLQLVQDAREACARGDPEACKRLEQIKRFVEPMRPKEEAR